MSNAPVTSAIAAAVAFAAVIFIFVVYDVLVQRRNENLVMKAARSNAVVSDLFPGAIRDKILDQENGNTSSNNKMKNFLQNGKVTTWKDGKPLAELYLDTTVLYADISGFTAWTSVREPFQVFTLLEALYQSFDQVRAARRLPLS